VPSPYTNYQSAPMKKSCFGWTIAASLLVGLPGYQCYKWATWSDVIISISKGCAVSRPVVDGSIQPLSTYEFVKFYLSPGRHTIECSVNKKWFKQEFEVPQGAGEPVLFEIDCNPPTMHPWLAASGKYWHHEPQPNAPKSR